MAKLKQEECKARLLERLSAAGGGGLHKKGLGITRSRGWAEALRVLEEERAIANLGAPKQARYVLREHFRPLELAYEAVAAKDGPGGPRLYTKTELGHGLRGALRDKLGEAIELLVQEAKLLRLQRGNTTFYLHTGVLARLPLRAPSAVVSPLTREQLLAAYRQAVQETGFANVLVEELSRRLDVPVAELHAQLLEECRAGHAVPTRGDWMFAGDAARKAALVVDGQPRLLIRFVD